MWPLTYGSVCSGIEAASVAWEPLGLKPAWFSEIESFPCKLLKQRYPHVTNLGDMTKIAASVRIGAVAAPDILVGGTPCQAFSMAGLRAGLTDPRGQLTIAFADLADAIDEQRPGEECVIVWENVPGVLSSQDNAFGCFLGLLAGEYSELTPEPKPADGRNSNYWKWNKDEKRHTCRWSNVGCVFGPKRAIAWRVLDAQYFGVAQRRRRVFLVASARKGFDPAKLLFESDGVRRDTPPSRQASEEIAGTLACRTNGGGFPGTDEACSGYVQPVTDIVCMAHGQGGAEISVGRSPTLTCNHEVPIACYAFQPRIARNGRGDMGDLVNALTAQAGETGKGDAAPCVAIAHVETLPTLRAGGPNAGPGHGARSGDSKDDYIVPAIVAHSVRLATTSSNGWGVQVEASHTLDRTSGPAIHYGMQVRRLIPRECERLQGFKDDYTLIEINGKPVADGPRYKAIGNSMATTCMHWLGVRLLTTHPQLFM